ncbi:MAG: aminopeptidase P family protein [Bacteroidales bacterium]
MFDSLTYVRRRAQLMDDLRSGLIVFLGNPELPANYADNTLPFRQDSSFLYFWGLDSPDLAASLDIDERRETIYGHDFTVDEIVWRGPQPKLADRAAGVGVGEALPREALAARVARALQAKRKVHFLPQYLPGNALFLEAMLGIRAEVINQYVSVDLITAIVRQRATKSAEEIAEIEKAHDTTAAMQVLAMHMAKPGVFEREVAGAMHGLVVARGVQLAFPIIFSIHGETLHNHEHGNRMQAGQMAVNDCGAEADSRYAADITRTIPIGGCFQGVQRDLYQAVVRAQQQAVAAIKPGVPFKRIHLLACRSLAEDLKALGLMRGDLDAAVEAGAHALFFQCGLGHMMGLDVHDMEGLGEQYVGYDETVQRSPQFGLKSLRMARALQPGFVMTVEPGLYFIPQLMDLWGAEQRFSEFINYEEVEKFRHAGGIRVEDDVVVTETGCRVIGQPIPLTLEDVEAECSKG